MKINEVGAPYGANRKTKRRGRGSGSGHGRAGQAEGPGLSALFGK